MSAVTRHPSAAGGMFRQQGHSLLVATHSLLQAIESEVLVVAQDIGLEQRREICREITLMRLQIDDAFDDAGLKKLPGSLHLLRETDIEESAGGVA